MREYGKIHSSFWTSRDIRELGEDGRTLAAYLLTSPHANMLGCFRCPIAYVSDDLAWPIERVREGFAKLSQRVWATFEEGSGWVVIHKFLKWNQPENPNVVRAAEKLFAQIPSSSGVKSMLAWAIAEFEPRFSAEKLAEFKPFANPFDTNPQAYRKPEPEPEPKPEPKEEANASVASDAGAPDVDLLGNQVESQQSESESVALHCPVARIVSAYHELMPGNPKVKVLNDKRKRAITARWREAAKLTCKPFGYATVDAGLKAWRAFFAVCAESDFLTGKAKGKPGQPPFIADIDFLTAPESFAKCLENKYHREAT
jgi:hypothetical protein